MLEGISLDEYPKRIIWDIWGQEGATPAFSLTQLHREAEQRREGEPSATSDRSSRLSKWNSPSSFTYTHFWKMA